MKNLSSALWVEFLKVRRSKVPFFTFLGFSIPAFIGGLFMIILKDPKAAQNMGLISTKAQLAVGSADWITYFGFISQAVAVGGGILFSIIAMWVFGREFADRTAKELLSVPTSRGTIITAKFIVILVWTLILTLFLFALGLLVGNQVDITGFSNQLLQSAFVDVIGSAILIIVLLPFVAFVASIGKGYMPAFGWTIFTVVIAQVSVVIGWGDWIPWAVPALFSGAAGARENLLSWHSYFIVVIFSILGLVITFRWWLYADQTK